MATIAGSVKSLSSGIFHAKDENGNIRVLQEGDTIYENDTVYGDNGNSSSSKIEILLSGNDVIVLSEGQKQLIDSSLIETAFGTEELFFTREGLDLQADSNKSDADVVSNLRDANFDDDKKADIEDKTLIATNSGGDVTDQDTAAGVQVVEDATDVPGIFQARDGNITNIVSDLRDAQFPTQNQININGSNLVIGNLSVNDISVYETEGFLIFTVSLDRSLASDISFDYATSAITASNNGVDYSDVSGRITIPAGSTSVTIRVPITDDYLSDNGETIRIIISNVDGNANITKAEGIGTILDNPVNNPGNGTTGTPTETDGYGEEDTVYAVITGATSVIEGETAGYVINLIDKDGNPVTVTNATDVKVIFTNVSTEDADTEYSNNQIITVTIPAGGSSITLDADTVDDYLADSPEDYKLTINEVVTTEFENVVIGDKDGNNKDVTTTIIEDSTDNPNIPGDEDTVYAVITGSTNVIEGETASYIINLVDKDGNPVTVTNATDVKVIFTNVSTEDADTEYSNNQIITVTIPAGGSSITLDADTVDDYLADSPEDYKLTINEVVTTEFENVVIGDKDGNNKDVTTTIIEDSTDNPNIPGDEDTVYAVITGSTNVIEGETASYIINLVDKDGNPVTVTNATDVKVIFTNVSTEDADTEYSNNQIITVTIPAGGSSITLDADTVDDYLADSPEDYKLTINEVVTTEFENVVIGDKDGNNKDVTTTIIEDSTDNPNIPGDEDTVYAVITGSTNVIEGETASYIINLVDKDGNPVTVTNATDVKVIFTNVSTEDADTEYSNNQIITVTIPAGGSSITLDADTVDDYLADSPEDYKLTINEVVTTEFENVVIGDKDGNNKDVTTTIIEDSTDNPNIPGDEDTVYAVITGSTNVIEGETASYIINLVDKDGNPVTVTNATDVKVIFTNVSTEDADTEYSNNQIITVTIPAGGSSITLDADTVDDYLADSPEDYKLTINEVVTTEFENVVIGDKDGNNKDVTTTIIEDSTDNPNIPGDEDTVYAVITGSTNVIEGETASYIINLVDKDGNPVTVTNATDVKVIFTNVSTEDADTEYLNNQIITVTIPAGGSSITLDADTVDDYLADSPEDYKLTINEVVTTEFENVVIGDKDGNNKDVTTTIIEDSTDNPNIPGDEDTVYAVITGSTNVIEGETASYIINLVDKDGNPVTVTEATDVTVKFTNITTQDGDTEYSNNQIITVTIPAGGSSITLDADTIDDYYEDSLEDYKLTIDGVDTTEFENVDIDGFTDTTGTVHSGSQITTITDDTGTPNNPTDGPEGDKEIAKVVLVAVTAGQTLADIPTDANGALIIDNTNTTPEGGKLYYIAVAVDADGKALTTQDGTVTVTYNDGSATHGAGNETDDYTVITTTATIGTTFSVDAEDDYYNDNNETFEVVISAPTGTSYENVEIDAANSTVTSTITDDTGTPNNPTDGPEGDKEIAKVVLVATNAAGDIFTDANGVVLINSANESVEGGKLYYIAVAVDVDGKQLISSGNIDVSFIDGVDGSNGATSGAGNLTDDYSHTTINIAIGEVFEAKTLDDFVEDSPENYTVVISNPTGTNYENVIVDSANSTVTSTIQDGVIVGAAAVAKVYEDALVDDIKDTDTSNPLISGEGISSALISEATLNITNPNNDTYSVEFKNGDFPTLTSEGQTVTIAINSSGVLIGTRTDGKEVFSVAFDKTDATKYTVTLSQPIDHTTGNDGYDLLNIPIEYIVSSDGSSIEKTMNITVVDSAPQLINETIVLNEDSSASSAGNTFILADEFVSGSGSSSLTLAGADISATNATVTIDENGADVTISGKTAVGTVTSNGDGSISFVPASNFSGTVTVDYTIIDFDGDIATTELTFEVTPIADAPTMQDNISLSTYEDNSWNGTSHDGDKVNIVALGLIVPTITDATDLTSGADDASERLSALTFKFGSNKDFDGAVVKYDSNGDGTLDATLQTVNRGDSFTIMISDITDYHPNGTTATYSLTQAQYNSLVIIPEADNANDISFTISTESHEVQDNGDLYATDIVSATKTQTVDIDVKAVTDPVTLREDTSATNYDGVDDQVMNITIAEDATLDLAALLVQTFGDNDSSESHYFDVSGLEPGTKITIGGTTRTADSNGDITQVKFTGDDTTFKITPPADWDGTMTGITLTLMAKDSDSDSTGVNQWETDSVTLNLTVTPVANDVVVVNPVSGEEDTAISLFVDANGDLTIQTTDAAGTSNDLITGVKILTSSIVGTISGGTTTIDGLYTVFDVNTLADYKITPPAHSSSDITMKLIVKTTDGTSVLEHSEVDYKVTVTPVAEEVGIDSDGDGIDDVTMTADHTYALDAKEDSWFTLGTDTGFNLESNWSNEDDTDLTAGSHATAQTNSEETFAHLTFTVSENGTYVEISGADYKYYNGSSYITVTDTGSGVDIPVAYLDTLEVLAPSQLSGDIRIEVQAKTVDYDEDTNAQVTSLSGLSYLTFTVDPVADIGIIQVAQSVGYEDAGRTTGNTSASGSLIDAPENGIDLNIKVSSDDKDGSETFNVQIDKIPDGGSLNVYDNSTKTWKLITISSDGTGVTIDGVSTSTSGNISVDTTADGTYKVTIIDYQNNQLAKFIPAHNDDTDYTFKVSSQTVDTSTTTVTGDYGTSKDLSVIVKNIADVAISNELKTDITANEDSQINLKDIYATPSTLASSDSSEELTIKIDLPDGFTIVSGSPYYIEDGMYAVKASDIIAGNIVIDIPDNFSGDTSFDLTYITTEKAGENDSKTWDSQTVNIFVNPIADDVNVATSSTIYEDADGNANKINIAPSLTDTDGSESVTAVKILASSVPSAYTLYSDASMTTELTLDANGYYIVTDANSVYAKNTTEHKLDGNFDLTVVYTVTDTVGSQTDIKDFTHVHTVNVNAVTDTPTIALGTISETSGSVTVVGTNVTVNSENSQFTVPVTTTSEDADSSEVVTKIVISGVPQGVEVVGATYYGYAGSEDNGIWVLTSNSDTTLDSNGALSDVVFKVNTGADFEERDITITTYIQDGANAQVENDSQTIHIDKSYTSSGPGPGNPPLFDLSTKVATIYEDNNDGTQAVVYNLGKSIDVANSGGSASGNYAITITDFPTGTTVSGASYSYENGGKTYYVVVGTGNAADVATKLSTVIVTPPTDMNTGGAKDGQMTFSATISTFDGGTFKSGTGIPSYTETIIPVTDKMTVAVTADNINEDATSNLSITLSNPYDGSKTELVGSSITIKVTENWLDSNANGEGTKGTLTDSTGTYNIVDNNDGTYTVTKINGSAFTLDTPITGLVYTPAENRDGDVIFEVSVKNKETGSTLELDSKGDKTITVSPMIDAVLDAAVTGTEDVSLTIGTTKLENAVKLEIATGTIIDGSEKLGNVILDEVPTGFTVWYVNTSGTLVMATNVGTTDNLTNQWLITAESDGSMPEVYINAPENWAGDFDFKAKFTLSEENLSTPETTIVNVTGHIDAVADGVTIAPTLTFGDAFSWVSLNLNANMKDVDGSETMSIKLTGLDDMAQFQLDNGTSLTSNATYNDLDSTWTIEGIQYDQINNVQFVNDTSSTVSVEAWTVDGSSESSHTNSETFDLLLTDVSGILTLNEGINLDFDKIENLSNIEEIDLSSTGANNILNLSLQDVIAMTDSSNDLKITGDSADSVTFKDGTGTDAWSTNSTVTEGGKTFDVYTNTEDTSVQVKVEQPISDGITN